MTVRLACHDVHVRLGKTPIVKGVSFTVQPGEWLSIIGPNGAGKSTLFRAITGLTKYRGQIELGTRRAADLTPMERAQLLAMVPQVQTIPAGMKVLDYVLLGRNPWIGPLGRESDEDVEIARAALADLDAWELQGRAIEGLSGGERQRVVIARALAQDAPLLLLDEPTTSLDIGHQQELLLLLERLRATQSLTLVTTMHDLTLAGHYADRLILLDDGVIAAEGPAATVLTAENIHTHYRASVRVVTDEDGAIVVVPMKPERQTP